MSKTILVVEDTEILRRMYSDRLESDGYAVLGAADGVEALAILRTHTPDLILLDLIMPRMSGLEVLDLIKRDPRLKDVPVLILSNLGQEDDIKRGIEMGAVDYLIKNDARPNDVSVRIAQELETVAEDESQTTAHTGAAPSCPSESSTYQLLVRDHEADADRFVSERELTRRLWCPACEIELVLELVPKTGAQGWYDAHLTCPRCFREF
jgi:CheY-like chemotaxis protein